MPLQRGQCGALVKRVMDRQPQVADCCRRHSRGADCMVPHCQRHVHRKMCGGAYVRVTPHWERLNLQCQQGVAIFSMVCLWLSSFLKPMPNDSEHVRSQRYTRLLSFAIESQLRLVVYATQRLSPRD